MLLAWKEQGDKLSADGLRKDDYDCYPKYETTQLWTKVPSQKLGDAMVKAFKNKTKD